MIDANEYMPMQFATTKSATVTICMVLLLSFFVITQTAFALTTTEIAKEFICNCGCNQMLDQCDMSCGEQLRGVITGKINEGWSKDKIVAYMIDNYGESLLAAPTKEGFNLTAWILPFAVVIAGGVFIYSLGVKWVRRNKESEGVGEEEKVAQKVGTEYEDKLDNELDKFEF
jgi:cytochrome c-type biogenesis protein CcmH